MTEWSNLSIIFSDGYLPRCARCVQAEFEFALRFEREPVARSIASWSQAVRSHTLAAQKPLMTPFVPFAVDPGLEVHRQNWA
jgi:hypothetical protein